ncbi:MAG TPA: YqgE/AlgH family protein [Solirubrobacteraceae bacterium]|nr:YqgE/AlgH family protein [Solirubrobacteraceae bacterium]
METLRGQLLVATPALIDPNFRRSVVLIGEHSEEGALGVVLNRPAAQTIDEVAPEVGQEGALYVGGPVQPGSLLVLAEFEDPSDAGLLIVDRIGFTSPGADLAVLDGWARQVRFFAGYAGWGPGQLDGEVENGDWIPLAFVVDDAFGIEPETLWPRVLERQGGRLALLARMPDDPSVN